MITSRWRFAVGLAQVVLGCAFLVPDLHGDGWGVVLVDLALIGCGTFLVGRSITESAG